MSFMDFTEKFLTVNDEFRGIPFWAWNAKLEKDELCRQIRLMKEMGFGGFVMHSRVGLDVPYLQEQWFDCVRTCVGEAKKQNMQVWMYDDDRWPSGYAGGIVTKDERFQARTIGYKIIDDINDQPDAVEARHLIKRNSEGEVTDYKRVEAFPEVIPCGFEAVCFQVKRDDKHTRFNGQTYLDTLNPDAVNCFIEVTHQAYQETIGKDFGTYVKAIFTDEPSFIRLYDINRLPWTGKLPELFTERYDSDLLDVLPELFFPLATGKFSQARLRFYNLLTDCFVTFFAKRIGDWCEEHGIAFTGHILREDTLGGQAQVVGTTMRFYEHMQIPGIDLLTERWNIFNTVKQCVSVARQFGRKWRLSETYGCTGWDFPLEGHKALGDWQYAMGINLRCPHLAWYSMIGEAKRDYPASIFYQSPWYKKYSSIEEYFVRLGSALSDGEEVRELLVLHPIESLWGLKVINDCELEEIAALDKEFLELSNYLLSQHLDFDFGDEKIIAENGSVEAQKFHVGCAAYSAVLLPQLHTIRLSTLELLEKFSSDGGKVFYLGTPPQYLDGELSDIPDKVFKLFYPTDFSAMNEDLSPVVRRVLISDDSGQEIPEVLYRLNETAAGTVLFVCNTSMRFSDRQFEAPPIAERCAAFQKVKIKLIDNKDGGFLYELNPGNGHIKSLNYDDEGFCSTSLSRLESRLFLMTKEKLSTAENSKTELQDECCRYFKLSGALDVFAEDYNVLVLDHVDGSFSSPDGAVYIKNDEYILNFDDAVRTQLDLPLRGEIMRQPWACDNLYGKEALTVMLSYNFNCIDLPQKSCFIALEVPEYYSTIEFNGRCLRGEDAGWWIDHGIRKIEIPHDYFRYGKNEIKLEVNYDARFPGLESIFLLGDFGVTDNNITLAPRSITQGDWCEKGFPYYAGNIVYRTSISCMPQAEEQVYLEFGRWSGTALEVRVNRGTWQFLAWPPYRADITQDWLSGQENTVEIRVYGHRRNACGPLYASEKSFWVSPNEFRKYEQSVRKLVPCGLLSAPMLKIVSHSLRNVADICCSKKQIPQNKGGKNVEKIHTY